MPVIVRLKLDTNSLKTLGILRSILFSPRQTLKPQHCRPFPPRHGRLQPSGSSLESARHYAFAFAKLDYDARISPTAAEMNTSHGCSSTPSKKSSTRNGVTPAGSNSSSSPTVSDSSPQTVPADSLTPHETRSRLLPRSSDIDLIQSNNNIDQGPCDQDTFLNTTCSRWSRRTCRAWHIDGTST